MRGLACRIFLLLLICAFPQFADDKKVDPKSEALTLQKPMAVDVSMVLVNATVYDSMNRFVTGLEKENFSVYEDKIAQAIVHFSSQDMPISIGVIFDTSGSMTSKIEKSREACIQFMKLANPQDEFFMVGFNDRVRLEQDFTSKVDDISQRVIFDHAQGQTALLDAIYYGIEKVEQGHYPRKALLIISDGGDNHSRYSERDVREFIKESDAQIFAIGIYNPYADAPEEKRGPSLLGDLAEMTGGRAYTLNSLNDLEDIVTKIAIELRSEYVLGYVSSNEQHDGRWRKIKVKLNPPRGLPPLLVNSKSGYYAPSN
ncbi:MAG: VWA domain-containing protein [Acidobacteriia bacterium]|nr:VWA domain-containing protein [Terriglobia bacterium]